MFLSGSLRQTDHFPGLRHFARAQNLLNFQNFQPLLGRDEEKFQFAASREIFGVD